jgi:hypothetical protein
MAAGECHDADVTPSAVATLREPSETAPVAQPALH